jgi:NADH-quinone oxidoreductase subunit N
MTFTIDDLWALLPALLLIGAGLLAVAVDLSFKGRNALVPLVLSLTGVGGAMGLIVQMLYAGGGGIRGFDGIIVFDDLTGVLSLGICAATMLTVAIAPVDSFRRKTNFGELYALLLISAAAMILLLASNDFMLVFINLEVLSIAMYVLTGITRRNPRSNEAALKYLVTGGFATGFLLMGVALLYGATGTIRLEEIGGSLATGNTSPLLPIAFGMLLVGFGFKIGAAPFHMWIPDVYEGAPTSMTAFMSVAVKAAATGSLIRVLLIAGAARADLWAPVLWWVALLTMFVGNILAIQQRSVKRMLALSSVAHTGYALVALATMQGSGGKGFDSDGAAAVVFYLFVYTFMTLGAFQFLVYMGHEVKTPSGPEWQDAESIDDLAGLGWRRPWAAAAMTVFLLSLAGIPPTAGFLGKFYLFKAAVDQGHWQLAVLGVMASLVSLYYYVGVVVAMYMKPARSTDEQPRTAIGGVIALTAVLTLGLGLAPGVLLDWAARSIGALH